MDAEIRRLWRKLVGTGQVESFIISAIEGMNLETKRKLFYTIRLLYEREQKIYGMGRQRVGVKYLSDDAIIDKINSRRFRDRKRDRLNGWHLERRRDMIDLILEEAEWRGLKSNEELAAEAWLAMTKHELATVLPKIMVELERCIERSHSFDYVGDQYICVNCRKKVSNEAVEKRLERVASGLLGRLWDTTRRIRKS